MASTSLSCKRIKDVCSDPCVITSEPRSINDLSDEILLNILSYFGPRELCLIAKVCERWNALAKDVVLWKRLSYTVHGHPEREIEEVLTIAPALDSLIIHDNDKVAENIMKFLCDKRVDLRRLTLNCGRIVGKYDLCATLVDLYPDLEGLSLVGSFPLRDFGHIARLKKLSELYLFDCWRISAEKVYLIVESCQHLKKIGFGRISIEDEDVIHLIDRLGKQLTTLVSNQRNLTDDAYSYLNNCTRLQELELCLHNNMTDRGLLEGIGSLLELTSLRLIGCKNLTAQALSTFLHRPSMSSIVLLELWICSNLDDEGLKGISERCIHLKELDVSCANYVTDAGVSMVIRHCSQLRVLSLTSITSITGEGWLTLVPSHLPHLRELSLLGCNVCDKYARKLKAVVPELKINR